MRGQDELGEARPHDHGRLHAALGDSGGRRLAKVPGGCVATRAMTLRPAGEQHADNQENDGDGNDPGDPHPAWWAGGRFPICAGHWVLLLCLQICSFCHFKRHTVYDNTNCLNLDVSYNREVPKLWSETIQAHRREVRDAILDTAAALVAEQGLLSMATPSSPMRPGITTASLRRSCTGMTRL